MSLYSSARFSGSVRRPRGEGELFGESATASSARSLLPADDQGHARRWRGPLDAAEGGARALFRSAFSTRSRRGCTSARPRASSVGFKLQSRRPVLASVNLRASDRAQGRTASRLPAPLQALRANSTNRRCWGLVLKWTSPCVDGQLTKCSNSNIAAQRRPPLRPPPPPSRRCSRSRLFHTALADTALCARLERLCATCRAPLVVDDSCLEYDLAGCGRTPSPARSLEVFLELSRTSRQTRAHAQLSDKDLCAETDYREQHGGDRLGQEGRTNEGSFAARRAEGQLHKERPRRVERRPVREGEESAPCCRTARAASAAPRSSRVIRKAVDLIAATHIPARPSPPPEDDEDAGLSPLPLLDPAPRRRPPDTRRARRPTYPPSPAQAATETDE